MRYYRVNGGRKELTGERLKKREAEEAAWPVKVAARGAAEAEKQRREKALNELIDEHLAKVR